MELGSLYIGQTMHTTSEHLIQDAWCNLGVCPKLGVPGNFAGIPVISHAKRHRQIKHPGSQIHTSTCLFTQAHLLQKQFGHRMHRCFG
ncbi:unnamed protein product [Ectocarpus sp. 6 AP-2014]